MLPVEDIQRWLRFCRATDDETSRLLAIADEATVEAIANRHLNRWGHANHQRDRIEREQAAEAIEVYQPEVIPGLLQTPEYTRALLLAIGSATPETVDDSVEARTERQRAVQAAGVPVHAVITEVALSWRPGSRQLRHAQLDHLIELGRRPNIQIGVVPLSVQRHVLTSNAFVAMRWADGTAEVEIESLTAEMTISEPEDVRVYTGMFELQRANAVYGDAAEDIIKAVQALPD